MYNSPESHAFLGIIETFNCAKEIRQRVLGVSADEGEKDPRRKQWRFGVPALLRKVPPGRTAPGQEQEEQHSGPVGGSVHSDNKLSMTENHL